MVAKMRTQGKRGGGGEGGGRKEKVDGCTEEQHAELGPLK